jgi:hypothetical protein
MTGIAAAWQSESLAHVFVSFTKNVTGLSIELVL